MGKMRFPRLRSFTLVELLVVISIIAILAGLVLGGAGAVRQRASRGQAKTEISALETALARYQMDMGSFPVSRGLSISGTNLPASPSGYILAGQELFTNLWGTNKFNAVSANRKSYINVKASMVNVSSQGNNPDYFVDPWGNAYGYYWTGTNSLFGGAVPDIWSTGGQTGSGSQTNRAKWITSWE